MSWRRSLAYFAVVVAIAILATLYYRATALTNLIPLGYDIFTYFYPNEAYSADSLRQGRLPLWNPYLFTGVPFLANSQTAVFYPLNLLFLVLPIPRAYVYSVLLHVIIAGCSMYAFSRVTLTTGRLGALAAACILMFSGFTGGLFGHLNQLHVVAWAPLVLLLFERSYRQQSLKWALVAGAVVGLQALAGHSQELYLTLVVLGLFFAWLFINSLGASVRESRAPSAGSVAFSFLPPAPPSIGRHLLWRLLLFAVAIVVGFALAAAQMVPTAELSTLSLRSGGLTLEEATSFSLPPWMLLKALLPVFGEGLIFSEWLGYIGIAGLLLAALAIAQRPRNGYVIFFAGLAILAVVLAMGSATPLYQLAYKLMPGINLFRVPARWLYPYTLAMASLAAIGLTSLSQRSVGHINWAAAVRFAILIILMAAPFGLYMALNLQPTLELPGALTLMAWGAAGLSTLALVVLSFRPSLRPFATGGIVAILVGELFAAGLGLELNRPNLPDAYTSLRPSVAHFLADKDLYRTLAATDNTFEPGDIKEMKAMVEQVLSPEQAYDYIVAAKHKETLTPNLPLLFRIPTLDGYDGGLLPLKRYVEFKAVFPASCHKVPAARFREQLDEVPPSSLLAWLNVKYFLTDRLHDAWVDGVYYDLGVTKCIESNEVATLDGMKPFATTSLGIVSYLAGGAGVPQGDDVAEVTVTDVSGASHQAKLRAGIDSAESQYAAALQRHPVAHQQPKPVGQLKGDPEAHLYLSKVTLPALTYPKEISIRSVSGAWRFCLRGLSLIDDRLGLSQPVPVDNSLRLVHLGDVKIYQNLAVAPRAFLVDRVKLAGDDEEALSILQSASFEPREEAVVLDEDWSAAYGHKGSEMLDASRSPGANRGEATVSLYEPERVEIRVSTEHPTLLVLTDSYYPGWRARVDGQEQPIVRTNHLFRGVLLEPGRHTVEFIYEPFSVKLGLAISLAALVLLAITTTLYVRNAPPL